MIPAAHPLASVRDAFNAVFVEGRAGRAADVLRSRRRRGPDARRASSATSSRGARHLRPGGRAHRLHVRARPRRPADGRDARASTTSTCTSRIAPACSPRSPSVFGRTTSRSSACGRREPATRRRSCSSPTAPARATSRRRCDELREMDAVRAVASLLRVEGEEGERAGHGRRPSVARRDRGVPRPAAGRRRHAGRHARRGRHAARAVGAALGRDRVRGLAEVRRREPDRLVQGPRDDARDLARRSRRARRPWSAPRPGNTSASAAAYAAKAGLTCAVLVPKGKVALGKMARHARARRAGARGRRQLRRLARGRPRPRRLATR